MISFCLELLLFLGFIALGIFAVGWVNINKQKSTGEVLYEWNTFRPKRCRSLTLP